MGGESEMNNYKVKVMSEAESKEVQGLFCQLGGKIWTEGEGQYRVGIVVLVNGYIYSDLHNFNSYYEREYKTKDISIPELRDLVSRQSEIQGKNGEHLMESISQLRGNPSLNDQYAEIEKVRQDAIGGSDNKNQNIETTLSERQSSYGDFKDVAKTTEAINALAQNSAFTDAQKMAMYMIASKIS